MGFRGPRGAGRRGWTRWTCQLAMIGVVACWQGAALGQALPELDYRVPTQCPSSSWFSERISPATPPRAQAAARLAVSVQQRGGGFEGQVELTEDATAGSPGAGRRVLHARQLRGADCQKVLSALVLSLSLYFDAVRDAPRSSEAASTQGTAVPDPALVLVSGEVTELAAPPVGASPESLLIWRWGPLAGALVRSGLSPGIDLNGRLGLVLGHSRTHQEGSLELGFELGSGSSARASTGAGVVAWEHDWWSVRATACHWSYPLLPWIMITPCLAAQAGQYRAQVADQPRRVQWFAWLEPGLQVQTGMDVFVRWELGVTVPIDPLGVEIDAIETFRQRLGLSTGLSFGMFFPESRASPSI
jgi:hypothetical protein